MPGKAFPKSQSYIIMDTGSLNSLILSDLLLTQNAEIWPAPYNLLHMDQSFLWYKHKLSLIKTFVSPGKFTDSGFQLFSFLFLLNKILRMSLQWFHFIMTFFGEPLEGKRWQSSTKAESIGTSVSSKISETFGSRPLSVTPTGITKISRHSLLEYYSLAASSPAHLFATRGKRKTGPGTLQTRDQNLLK